MVKKKVIQLTSIILGAVIAISVVVAVILAGGKKDPTVNPSGGTKRDSIVIMT